MTSWEDMAEQVVIQGRPGDVRSAALDWDQMLKSVDAAQGDLNKHFVTDLGQVWKGPAYDAFKAHIQAISKQLADMNANARLDDTIVGALNNAAQDLENAQAQMPIPAVCVPDLIKARNMQMSIPAGFFTIKLKSSILHGIESIPVVSHLEQKLMDWIWDKSDAAAKVYKQVDDSMQNQTYRTPGNAGNPGQYNNNDKTFTPPGGGGGGLPGSGKMPGTGAMPKSPSLGGGNPNAGGLPGIGDSGLPPGSGGGSGLGDGSGLGGGGGFDPTKGGGLAGAGGGLSDPGLGGLGGGGLGGAGGGLGGVGGGLGGAGGGLGGLSGGGSIGKGVMPSMGGMMGGGMGAGAGRGGAGSRSGRGAMAGGHGGGHGDSEDERTTWLQEDDDPWGTDRDTPSSVLK